MHYIFICKCYIKVTWLKIPKNGNHYLFEKKSKKKKKKKKKKNSHWQKKKKQPQA